MTVSTFGFFLAVAFNYSERTGNLKHFKSTIPVPLKGLCHDIGRRSPPGTLKRKRNHNSFFIHVRLLMQLDTAMDHGLSTLELITLKKLIMPFDSQTVLIVAAILFMLGLVGVLTRRNIIFILISVEIMLNAAGLAFVAAGTRWGQPDGQVMFLFILAMAASEVSVGLALVMQAYRQHKTLNVDELRALRDEGGDE